MQKGIPRSVEIVLALSGLIVSSPLLIIAALLILVSSPGPVLFRQIRVGQFGKSFELLKFRSMRLDNGGAQITAKGDVRITRVGRLLRKSKMDELPELWNVARGDLSLVGPRPEVPRYVDLKSALWQCVLETRPGITDPVTLRLRNEEELLGQQSNPEIFYLTTLQSWKLLGYVKYLAKRSAGKDLRVIWDTLLAVAIPNRTSPPSIEEMQTQKDSDWDSLFNFS